MPAELTIDGHEQALTSDTWTRSRPELDPLGPS